MPSDLAKLAYARMLNDQAHRVFYRHPKEAAFVEAYGADKWLESLEERVRAGTFVPGPFPYLEVPKAGWHIRPGIQLSLEDQFVYAYLALQAVDVVGPALEWSADTVRFSYRLSAPGKQRWFRWRFNGWKNFSKVSLGKIAGEAKFVLESDVSGFYENIDIGRLVQELRAVGVDGAVAHQLSSFWNKWCGTRQRGIPQGYSPSDLFAEFYMDPLDLRLKGANLDHIRYVDDIRIFTPDELSARKGLHELERTLRTRGLNQQTAKTKILTADAAKEKYSRVQRLLGQLSSRMAQELQLASDAGGSYVSLAELREYLKTDPEKPKPEVVNRAWESFVNGEFGPFDPTIFHYLLGRLADLLSPVAEHYCLDILLSHPEETIEVLEYFTAVKEHLANSTIDALAELLRPEADLLFDYQRHLIMRWFYEMAVKHSIVIQIARNEARSGVNRLFLPHWLTYLGDHTDEEGDFVMLERGLQRETSTLMRATYAYALRRWSSSDRNVIYGRLAGESWEVDGAVKCAKAETE